MSCLQPLPVPVEIVSREPWPEQGIYNYRSIDDGEWGWLLFFSDNTYCFSRNDPPDRAQILARWGSYFAIEPVEEKPE